MNMSICVHRVNRKLGQRLYEPMATLLAQLGQPDSRIVRRRGLERTSVCARLCNSSVVLINKCMFSLTRVDAVSSPLEEYLVTTGSGIDHEQLDEIKKLRIFYRDGRSKAGHPVCYYVARKFK